MNRRRFLRRALGGALAVGLPLDLYAWRIEPGWVDVVERPLSVTGLPADLEERTLLHLSDLHVGTVDLGYLVEALRRAAALEPDFVVCTGDWITAGSADAVARLREVLPAFPRGRVGTAGSLGNHDYGDRWRRSEQAAAVTEVAEAGGIRILRNEAATFAGLQFVGLEDLWSGRFDARRALAAAQPGIPTIVLSHNPDTADRPDLSGFRGWILSGHTHGGQVRPPFLPPPLLPVRNRRYTAGAFELGAGRFMYINRGLGYELRIRLNVRPELTLFRLARRTDGSR